MFSKTRDRNSISYVNINYLGALFNTKALELFLAIFQCLLVCVLNHFNIYVT